MKRYENNIFVSKKELYIISRGVIEFAQEMYWASTRLSKEYNNFCKKFHKKFTFSVVELDYVEESIGDLEFNIRNSDVKEIEISFPKESQSKRKLIIYTSLKECSKNFEEYEMSIRSGITKEQLDKVLNDFKALFPEKI